MNKIIAVKEITESDSEYVRFTIPAILRVKWSDLQHIVNKNLNEVVLDDE